MFISLFNCKFIKYDQFCLKTSENTKLNLSVYYATNFKLILIVVTNNLHIL